jgi:hypothetical protein
MSDADRLELFEVAEDALMQLEQSFMYDARQDNDPANWRCGLSLAELRRTVTELRRKMSAVMVTAGVADSVPAPSLADKSTMNTALVDQAVQSSERGHDRQEQAIAEVRERMGKPKSKGQRADGWTGGGV